MLSTVETISECVNSFPQPAFVMHLSRRKIVAWNTEFRKLIGYPDNVIQNLSWSKFIQLKKKPLWREWILEINRKKILKDIDASIRNIKGRQIPVTVALKKMNVDEEDLWIITLTDISEFFAEDKRRRKNEIREQRLRFHYENSPLGLVEWDQDFNVITWSKSAERIFGWKARETLGKPIYNLNLIYPEDIPVVEKTMAKLTGGNLRTVVSGNRNVTKDGRVIHCTWYNTVLTDEDKKMVSVMSLVNDITHVKETETQLKVYSEVLEARVLDRTHELNQLKNNLEDIIRERTSELESNNKKLTKEIVARRRAVEALQESERKYREIVQNIPGMVFQLKIQRDGSNRFTYISPKAGDLFDIPFDKIKDEVEFTNFIHPDDRAGFIASIGEAVSQHSHWDFEGRILTRSNNVKWFSGVSSPSMVGQELVMDGIMFDITDKKLAQEAIQRSEEHFRSLFTSIEEGFFVAKLLYDEKCKPIDWKYIVANHAYEEQVRAPLTGVSGQKGSELTDIEPEMLETIHRVVRTKIPEHYKDLFFIYHTNDHNFAVISYNQKERKEIQEKILEAQAVAEESQMNFSKLFDSMTDGVIICDVIFDQNEEPVDYVVLKVNPAFYKQTGINFDITGMRITEAVPTIEPYWIQLYGRVAKTGTPETIESKNNQTNKWFFEYTYKLSGNKCVGVFRDITESKQMQQRLEISEKRYKFMLDYLKEGIEIIEMIFDDNDKPVDFLYLDVNDEWYRQTGITFNIVGRRVKEAIPEIEDYWLNSYANVAKTGTSYYQKNYNKFTNKYYLVRTFRIDGNICASMVLDITEKQAEEDDLKVNLTKYQVLFNQFPFGITISDRSGHIIEMNEVAREILDVKEPVELEEIISGKKRNLIRSDGSVLPPMEFAGNQALQNSKTISNQELGIMKDSGEVRWISATSAPISLNSYGVATVFKDITEQVKTRENLEESKETLKYIFDTMSEALAVHEVILDDNGKPEDYVFIEVNPAFESQTGLKRDSIIGARASQFKIGKDIRTRLAEVAITGKPISLEYYNTVLKKNFKIFAFSQVAGQFVTIFREIESQRKHERIRT